MQRHSKTMRKSKLYLAPMEGLTGHVFRETYARSFGCIDKYFTPFISATVSKSLKTKELRDVTNNTLPLVPQIMANETKSFLSTAKRLRIMGYEELNLNLGCPSGTVTGKGRGSGFLAKPKELDAFLYEVFSNLDGQRLSVKTRLGMYDRDSFPELLNIYNKYPISELIIHPRTRQDFYGGTPDLEAFAYAVQNTDIPLCYNGDVNDPEFYKKITDSFPNITAVMLGRGLITDPTLAAKIDGNQGFTKAHILTFMNELYTEYLKIFGNDAIFRMKELWTYTGKSFEGNEKPLKAIKKAKNTKEYETAVGMMRI